MHSKPKPETSARVKRLSVFTHPVHSRNTLMPNDVVKILDSGMFPGTLVLAIVAFGPRVGHQHRISFIDIEPLTPLEILSLQLD